jgi:hypothetical protein
MVIRTTRSRNRLRHTDGNFAAWNAQSRNVAV